MSKGGFDIKTFELGLQITKLQRLEIKPVDRINYYLILAETDETYSMRSIRDDLNLNSVKPVNAFNRSMIEAFNYQQKNEGWRVLGEIGIGLLRAFSR